MFHKVVWQHMQGVAGLTLLQIHQRIFQWQNSENGLRFDRIMATSLLCSFFGPPCMTVVYLDLLVAEQGTINSRIFRTRQ